MGRHQIYRGDPTQKQYYVTNNFSGGINTVSVDENMRDNEFRDLVNVDIATQGIIQSRKGFKEIEALVPLFVLFSISLPTTAYSFIKVLNNSNNILEQIVRGGTSYVGNLKILMITNNSVQLLSYDGTTLALDVIGTLPAVPSYKENLISNNVVEHVNKIYISLNDLSEKYKGILIYDRDTDTFKVWKGQYLVGDTWTDMPAGLQETVYKPKPYDISTNSSSGLTQGFNVLADEPLLYIDSQGTGLPSLRAIILTDANGNYLEKIPTNGQFIANVIKTGTFRPENLQFKFRDQNNNYIGFEIGTYVPTYNVWGEDEDGAEWWAHLNPGGVYDVQLSEMHPGGIVGLFPSVPAIGTRARVYITTTETYYYYLVHSAGDYYSSYGVDNGGYISYEIDLNDLSSVDYVLMDVLWQDKIINFDAANLGYLHPFLQIYAVKDEYFIYQQNDNVYGNDDRAGTKLSDYVKLPVDFRLIVGDVYAQEPEDVGIFDTHMLATNNNKIFQFVSENKHRTFKYNHGTLTFIELTSDGILYDNWEHVIPLSGSLISMSISLPNYYMYLDLPNISDLNWAVPKTEINLDAVVPGIEGQHYDIGDDDPEEPVEGLDLEDVKLITIDNKLVYYKGNTIYFSNIYQFDYVPNFAFVILPLLSTDEIIKIKYFKGSWIIFTKNTIWKMKGTYGDADWEIQLLNDSIGCIAPNSIVSIENSLYFLSQNGLYRLVQNYYQDGLENVAKADRLIPDLIPIDSDIQSLLYRDQYIMYLQDGYDFDTVRMYYNIDLADKQKPFVKDKFAIRPNNLFSDNGNLYSIKDGKIYIYDEGYTDFMPSDAISEDDYLYTVAIKSSALNFGYPTHDKKIKSIYIKTKSDDPTYLYFTIWLDGYLRAFPTSFRAVLDENEEIVYEEYIDYTKDSNLKLHLAELGELELGNDVLGDNENSVHKITLGYKGKTIQLKIEQQSNGNFGITNIGYLYKLGKVKEQR
jgi:hypothetical protein